jgi:branched-chain amino acid transport system permease protein
MTRILDFAQGDKVVLGGLIGLTLVRSGLPVIIVLLVVGVGGLLAGGFYDRIVVHPSARNGAIAAVAATVGASMVIANGESLIYGTDGLAFPSLASGSFRVAGVPVSYQSVVIWVVLAIVATSLWFFMTRTKFGKGIVAAASDPLAATAVGVSPNAARGVTFALAFGLAAMAGVLVAPLTLAGGGLGTTLTLDGFAGAILGGLTSTPGVIVGSLLLGVVQNLVGGWLPNGYENPLVYGLIVVVLLVLPSGIFGLKRERLA